MRADIIERRRSALARLSALRDAERLTTATVEAAAVSLAVHPRTVWRWLSAGSYEPAARIAWTLTPEAVQAFYAAGGRVTGAWRALREAGEPVPSLRTFARAVARELSPAERAYARAGEDGRRRYSVYLRWEPEARNEVWQADHAQLDVLVIPPRGSRLVRPWLTVIQDTFSRLVMGWVLSLHPSSAEVLAALREAIVVDPARGPWGGVPEQIRFDGGKDFLAEAVARATAELGCLARPTAPYSPYQKGKVERLHRTIGEGLIATLPHYTGGPRRADTRLYAQPPPLSLPQLQTRVREFIDDYNTVRPHSSLAGLTPAQKWATSAVPLDVVAPERLRWMLLADQTRRVLKDGIHFGGVVFIASELAKLGGRTVEVRHMPHDLRSIEVFTETGWVCTAHPQHALSREEADAVLEQRRAAAAEMGRRRAAVSRKARTRVAPITADGAVADITAVAAKRRPGRRAAPSNANVDAALRVLGLEPRPNKSADERREERL